MGYFFLVLVVAFLAGIIGVVDKIREISGPVLTISAIIIGVTLIASIISRHRK